MNSKKIQKKYLAEKTFPGNPRDGFFSIKLNGWVYQSVMTIALKYALCSEILFYVILRKRSFFFKFKKSGLFVVPHNISFLNRCDRF